MKFSNILNLAAVFFALVSFYGGDLNAEKVSSIAAVVNNEIITEIELKRAIGFASSSVKDQKKTAAGRQEILEKLVDEKLFGQLMAKSKIEISEDDIAKAIANVLQRNRMSLEELRREVSSKGMSYEDYKKEIELEIKRVKFINQVIGPQVKITDQDLRDFYGRNQERFRGTHSAHLAEIVLPLDGITTEMEMKKTGETALSIVAKARHGTPFDSLAKEYSKGPNVEKGGDIGNVNLKDLPAEVSGSVRAMRPGDVSNPILVGSNLVIVKVVSLPEISTGDFDKMRDDIYNTLYEQKIEETLDNYLSRERQKAFIEIR